MDLNGAANPPSYTTHQVAWESWIISKCEFGNFIFVISNVEPKVPGKCWASYKLSVNGKFNPAVFHIAYISKNLIGKVSSCGLINYTKQISCFLQIKIHTSRNAIIPEAIINPD